MCLLINGRLVIDLPRGEGVSLTDIEWFVAYMATNPTTPTRVLAEISVGALSGSPAQVDVLVPETRRESAERYIIVFSKNRLGTAQSGAATKIEDIDISGKNTNIYTCAYYYYESACTILDRLLRAPSMLKYIFL